MKIVTLCGMGFGTALMLKMFLDDILRDLGVRGAEIVAWDMQSFKGVGNVDIVVAPQDMEFYLKDVDADVIFLDKLTDTAEMKRKLVAVLKQRGDLPE
jgi:PTS system ascorbate-specific IIB component